MIHLEIDDEDRDLLLMALGQMTSTFSSNREHALDLLKRLAQLQPESEVATLDVSSNVWYCNECHARGPAEGFEHRPHCRWVARYGR